MAFECVCRFFFATLLMFSFGVGESVGKDVSFALNEDHISYQWRTQIGKPRPTPRKTLVWMLHEQVI